MPRINTLMKKETWQNLQDEVADESESILHIYHSLVEVDAEPRYEEEERNRTGEVFGFVNPSSVSGELKRGISKMHSAKEKISNVASAAKEKLNVGAAKTQEQAEKATARTEEERAMAHEHEKAKEGQAKAVMHEEKATHAAEKQTQHLPGQGHTHVGDKHYGV